MKMASTALLAALAAGCGSDRNVTSAGDELVEGFRDATCMLQVCTFGLDPTICGHYPGFDLFADASLNLHLATVEDLREAIEAGTVSYGPGRAADCFDRVREVTASCWGQSAEPRRYRAILGDLQSWSGACDGVITGLLVEGDTCHLDEECQSGMCSADGMTCPGQCLPTRQAGQRCEVVRRLANGNTAFEPGRCVAGLECLSAGNGYVCVPEGSTGTRCLDDGDCQSGLGCYLSGHCGPCPGTQFSNVCTYTFDGTCRADRDSFLLTAPDCEGNQSCVGGGERGTCRPPEHEGGVCAGDGVQVADCFVGLECRDGKCHPPPGVGESCQVGERCGPGAYCESSLPRTCRAQKPAGEVCVNASECLDAYCSIEHLCQPAPEIPGCHR